MASIKVTSSKKIKIELTQYETTCLLMTLEDHVGEATKNQMWNRLTTDEDVALNLFESVLSEFYVKHFQVLSFANGVVKITMKRSEALVMMQFLKMYENDNDLLSIRFSLHKVLV